MNVMWQILCCESHRSSFVGLEFLLNTCCRVFDAYHVCHRYGVGTNLSWDIKHLKILMYATLVTGMKYFMPTYLLHKECFMRITSALGVVWLLLHHHVLGRYLCERIVLYRCRMINNWTLLWTDYSLKWSLCCTSPFWTYLTFEYTSFCVKLTY